MAAAKANYIIVYPESSQVYTATTLPTAVKTPVPKGCSLETRMILFMSYLPDEKELCVYLLDDEQLKLKEEKPIPEPVPVEEKKEDPDVEEDEEVY